MWRESIRKRGFAVISDVVADQQLSTLLVHLEGPGVRRTRAGVRHAMGIQAVRELAYSSKLLSMARQILGDETLPIRATLFDKSPSSNWLVVWHQDTALPLRERCDAKGWGPWSVKHAVVYARAPSKALEQVLAIRIHLDDSIFTNGPLRVLPGTHEMGVLTDDELQVLAEKIAPIDCLVPRGGVLLMRPLIVHASSKSSSNAPRRVLHIEYASSLSIGDGMQLAIA
jgi:ectoine hydroxylase-related dioxygenase (phytanoyl-CoA dioxygenase family)